MRQKFGYTFSVEELEQVVKLLEGLKVTGENEVHVSPVSR